MENYSLNPNSKLKLEFCRRLSKVITESVKCLKTGRVDAGLYPALFSLYSYLWNKCPSDLLNKNIKDAKKTYEI